MAFVVLPTLALLAVQLLSVGWAAVPDGVPYLAVNISLTSTFQASDIQSSVANWFVSNAVLLGATASDVVVTDSVLAQAGVQSVNLTLNTATYDNVRSLTAWNAIAEPMTSGAVLSIALYTATSAVVVENPATVVIVSMSVMNAGYNYSWASFSVRLSTTPVSSTNVIIGIAGNSSDVEFSSATVTITYPAKTGSFRLRAPLGAYSFTLSVSGGTDTLARYTINSTQSNVWVVGYRENVTIVEPTTDTYADTPSDSFSITAPRHRDRLMDLVVTVIPSSNALSVQPSNVTIPGPNIAKFFTVTGPSGVYTLTYLIADPWVDGSGSAQGTTNTDFYQPTVATTLVIHDPLNITVNSMPKGFFLSEPDGRSWGGAFSVPITVHIEKPPRVYLQLTPSSDTPGDVEFFPSTMTFLPGGLPRTTFIARALTTGYKTISFTRSGTDARLYSDPASKLWIVSGKNRNCYTATTADTCWGMSACQWDASRGWCSNTTLTPLLGHIPELFDQESTENITLTLPTAPLSDLSVTFVAAQRLSFTPSSLTFRAGETVKNFTITGYLLQSDGRVRQNFRLLMSGTNGNSFTQLTAFAYLRPRVMCEVVPPNPFFVGTVSDRFTLVCEADPEVDVTFTPRSLVGISWVPVGGSAGDGITMTPGVFSGSFIAVSTTTKVGSFEFDVVISGTNAARYSAVPKVSVTILPSGELLPPASFFLTAYDISPFFHIDVTVQAPSILYIDVAVETAAGAPATDAFVFPTTLKYNHTKRNFIRAIGYNPGLYRLVFSIGGINKANYIQPKPLPFEVKDRLDGPAFLARTTVGFLPMRRCRVSVGRQSLNFLGQDPVDGQSSFCSDYVAPMRGTVFDCSVHRTEERCRNEMSTNGNVCVWHQNACIFLPSLQGYLKMVSYGSGFTVMLTQEGAVWSIGSTRYGQLGHFNETLGQVSVPENISAIVSGTSHTIALGISGKLYSWGANYKGQLGQNTLVKQTANVGQLNIPKGEIINCITSGTLHSGALAASGKVYMWGSNEYGQLGNEASYRSISLAPQAIRQDFFDGEPVLAVQCGEYHTMTATALSAYTFGQNSMGQLGRPGFDEWKPDIPVLWTKNAYNSQPLYPSYITGRSHC